MEAAGYSVAHVDPRDALADGSDLARTVGKRYHAYFRGTATAAIEDHQVTVIERAGAHSHQDVLRPGSRVWARSKHNAINSAETVDTVGFHLLLPRLLIRKFR